MSIRAGVVIPVPFQQIDTAPHTQPAAERDLLLPVEGVSEPMGAGAIDEILRRYPSYEAYFADEFGLDAARLKALRDFYLE